MRRVFIALIVAFTLPVSVHAQQPVKVVDATGADVPVATTTEAAHDSALGTLTAVKALLAMCRGFAGTPAAVSADNDAVLGWCNLLGARAMFPTANAAGGDDPCYQATTASTNAFNCKTTAGTVYELSAINTTSTIYYLRLYNLAAAPTCSSATGFVETVPVPASTSGAGVVRNYAVGRAFSLGVGGCVTGGPGSTDATSAAVGVYITLGYK